MSNSRFSVELFDGTGHFGMWQGEVLDALFQQGLDIAIEDKKPDDVDEKEWKTINRLACGTIRSCLSREQKYAFKNETSAYKLWKALEDKFLKKNSQNWLHMKKRLFRFDYRPSTSMNDHITAFNQLVADLLNLDETFKDEDLALMLLSSLPDDFEYLCICSNFPLSLLQNTTNHIGPQSLLVRLSKKSKWNGLSHLYKYD